MNRSIVAAVLAVVLASASAFAQENVGQPKPPASIVPPAHFDIKTTTPRPTTAVPTTTNHTTVHTTTNHTTVHTTTNHTTAHTTTNHTTAHTTTNHTTAHHTTANSTTSPANVTTPANMTTTAPTTHNSTTGNMTTTISPTTSSMPKPTPTTNVTAGDYTVTDKGNQCIRVHAAFEVYVNTSKVDGKFIVQPWNTKFNGSCEKTTAHITLRFKEGSITMKFLKNETTKMVYVNSLSVNFTYAFKAGEEKLVSRSNDSVQLFSMTASHSYSCKSESVFMGSGVSLKLSENRLQAFNFTSKDFGQADLCKADQPDYRVAIAVGVVLIILIVIVIIAYLISRRKRTDGYQSL